MVAVLGLLSIIACNQVMAGESTQQQPPPQPKLSKAQLKAQYETALSKGDSKTALAALTKLIGVEDSQLNYFLRSEVYSKRREYSAAMADLERALDKDPKFLKAYFSLGRLRVLTGACDKAKDAYAQVLALKPQNKEAPPKLKEAEECARTIELANRLLKAGQLGAAKDTFDKAMSIATESDSLLAKKAEVSLLLGDVDSVLRDTLNILKRDQKNLEALELKGRAHYQLAEHDMALKYYREGLRLAPEHVALKKLYKDLKLLLKHLENGEEELKQGQFAQAAESFKLAYEVDPNTREFHIEVRLKQADALSKGKDLEGALHIFSSVLSAKPNHVPTLMRRGEVYLAAERWQEAVNDYQSAVQHDNQSREAQEGLRKAELELKKSKRKDYYKELGVPKDADDKAIKKAFRKLALQWHPDKHTDEEERKKAEVKFREIGAAYEVLIDPEARGKYDRGEDIEPQQHQHHQHPFAHFQNFNFQWG